MKLTIALVITVLLLTVINVFQNYVLYRQHVLIKEMIKNPSCLIEPKRTFDGDVLSSPYKPKEQ